MTAFDFDYWKTLAETSPLEFEARRKEVLLTAVAEAPAAHQVSLGALVGKLCQPQEGSGLERAVRAQALMNESLLALQKSMVTLLERTGQPAPAVSPILEFTTLAVEKR